MTFEGIDFSGKTTQAEKLVARLQHQGAEVVFLREPGGTAISEAIRRILLDTRHAEMHPRTELFLYSAARAQMVEQVIRPALKAGKIVICDRYYDSTTAYQGYGRGLDLHMIQTLNEVATNRLKPDLTILIDIPLEIAIKRHRKNGDQKDRLEKEEWAFHHRVRQGYLELAGKEPGRFLLIDGNRPAQQIHEEIWQRVAERFNLQVKGTEEL